MKAPKDLDGAIRTPDALSRAVEESVPVPLDPPPEVDGSPPWPEDDPGPGEPGEEAPAPEVDLFEAARRMRGEVSIRAACDRFLARLESGGTRPIVSWPGTPLDWYGANWSQEPIRCSELRPLRQKDRPRWDHLWRTVGPLWPDRLAVLVGRTGGGKSALAVQVAEGAALAGVPVLYASAEMGTDELVARLLALRAQGDPDPARFPFGLAYRDIMQGRAELETVRGACDALVADCPALYLWAPLGTERDAPHLWSMARAVALGEDGKERPPVVVLDYVQRWTGPDTDDKRLATSAISAALRDLSRPGGLPGGWPGAVVLALSSTARANYEHFQDCVHLEAAFKGGLVPTESKKGPGEKWIPPIPLEGMGKETGELEFDAPLVLDLATDKGKEGQRPDYPRDALVVVAKNRHGGTGMAPMTFYPASGMFRDRAATGAATSPKPGVPRPGSGV